LLRRLIFQGEDIDEDVVVLAAGTGIVQEPYPFQSERFPFALHPLGLFLDQVFRRERPMAVGAFSVHEVLLLRGDPLWEV
jgi:hypothetical protein